MPALPTETSAPSRALDPDSRQVGVFSKPPLWTGVTLRSSQQQSRCSSLAGTFRLTDFQKREEKSRQGGTLNLSVTILFWKSKPKFK